MFVINEECDLEDLGNGIKRKILAHAGGLMSVEVHFEKDAVGALHHHPHEQLSYVLSGVFDFTIDGVTREVRAGDTLYKKPNVIHGCVCREKGALLDLFTPQRQDFLKK